MPDSHRGRIQAQGGKTEKSVSWSRKKPPTRSQARGFVSELIRKLNSDELKARQHGITKALQFIDDAAAGGGVNAPVSISFKTPQTRDIRVDIEVRLGMAFVPDE